MSDLTEYAYCPRAFYYRHHPPDIPLAPEVLRVRDQGHRFHERTLRAHERVERHGGVWMTLAVASLAFLAAATLWILWA